MKRERQPRRSSVLLAGPFASLESTCCRSLLSQRSCRGRQDVFHRDQGNTTLLARPAHELKDNPLHHLRKESASIAAEARARWTRNTLFRLVVSVHCGLCVLKLKNRQGLLAPIDNPSPSTSPQSTPAAHTSQYRTSIRVHPNKGFVALIVLFVHLFACLQKTDEPCSRFIYYALSSAAKTASLPEAFLLAIADGLLDRSEASLLTTLETIPGRAATLPGGSRGASAEVCAAPTCAASARVARGTDPEDPFWS